MTSSTSTAAASAAAGKSRSPVMLFLSLSRALGNLAEVVQWKGDKMATECQSPEQARSLDQEKGGHEAGVALPAGALSEKEAELLRRRFEEFLKSFFTLTQATGTDVMAVWRQKLQKVRAKYPAHLCKGSADKYTAYVERLANKDAGRGGEECGGKASEEEQKRILAEAAAAEAAAAEAAAAASTESSATTSSDSDGGGENPEAEGETATKRRKVEAEGSSSMTPSGEEALETRSLLRCLVKERDWDQFHTSRNLLLALTGEIGEVAEEIQKMAEDPAGGDEEKRAFQMKELGGEVADCWSYIVRFCDVSGIDLGGICEGLGK